MAEILRTPRWDVVVLTNEEDTSRNGVYRLVRDSGFITWRCPKCGRPWQASADSIALTCTHCWVYMEPEGNSRESVES